MVQPKPDRILKPKDLIPADAVVLVAVSGGIDSMVLLHFLISSGIRCAVAHVNFGLRGKESDEDAEFVRNIAEEMQIPFHIKIAETKEYAEKNQISVQMAARELRYGFFREVMDACKYDLLATAHQLNDHLENFFLYLIRGNINTALKGIPVENGDTVRPILEWSRSEIEEYAAENQIRWREDSSNKKTDYLRNKIRHMIIPGLLNYYPQALKDYLDISREFNQLVRQKNAKLTRWLAEHLNVGAQHVEYIPRLKKDADFKDAMTYKLRSIGFHNSQIASVLSGKTGSEFLSSTHRLMIESGGFRIVPLALNKTHIYHCFDKTVDLKEADAGLFEISFEELGPGSVEFQSDVWFFDLDKIQFPLTIRSWRKGDNMTIWGMKGHKKLSDLFTDTHVGRWQRDQFPVLEDASGILGVGGIRRSSGAGITGKTEKILKVSFRRK